MNSTSIEIVPSEELLTIKRDISRLIELAEKRPEQLFQLRWIESKKVPPLLGISNRTWQSWRDKRIIPFSQFGAKIYVKLDDLNALLEAHRIENSKTV
ncbi:MAG: helix-turn-helix domain-containing protein [Bacteroidetes bacterium]|nr:helix-turn-helix domain-containing protein [Bacteroidota bacterium]